MPLEFHALQNGRGGEPAVISPAAVIMISGEDDSNDTTVPRLIAAGADLSKIHIISDVVETREGELSALAIDAHMKSVHAEMLKQKAALLIFDPVSAFLADRDSHRDSSVRALLNKIRQFAVTGNYAVLLISHFSKPGEQIKSAVNRVIGSIGFVAAARSVYAFVRDPEDADQRLVLPIKNNLSADSEGFRCRIKVDYKQKMVPRPVYLKWEKGTVKETRIDEVLSLSPQKQATKTKKKKIKKWLRKTIKSGHKMASTRFEKERKNKGFSAGLVRDVMSELGYKRVQRKGLHPTWDVSGPKEKTRIKSENTEKSEKSVESA